MRGGPERRVEHLPHRPVRSTISRWPCSQCSPRSGSARSATSVAIAPSEVQVAVPGVGDEDPLHPVFPRCGRDAVAEWERVREAGGLEGVDHRPRAEVVRHDAEPERHDVPVARRKVRLGAPGRPLAKAVAAPERLDQSVGRPGGEGQAEPARLDQLPLEKSGHRVGVGALRARGHRVAVAEKLAPRPDQPRLRVDHDRRVALDLRRQEAPVGRHQPLAGRRRPERPEDQRQGVDPVVPHIRGPGTGEDRRRDAARP